jgi:hypothetical protein
VQPGILYTNMYIGESISWCGSGWGQIGQGRNVHGSHHPRDTLSKRLNVLDFSSRDTSVGDTSSRHQQSWSTGHNSSSLHVPDPLCGNVRLPPARSASYAAVANMMPAHLAQADYMYVRVGSQQKPHMLAPTWWSSRGPRLSPSRWAKYRIRDKWNWSTEQQFRKK